MFLPPPYKFSLEYIPFEENNINSFPPLDRGGQEGCQYNDNVISTPTPTLPIKGGRRCAFTLAEVLITLVIIGVIAAITAPTLIAKYQKEQTVTRLKKAYSTLSQTTQRAIMDNGPMKTWEVGEFGSSEAAKKFLDTYIYPYVQHMGEVTTYSENGNWTKIYFLNGTERNDYTNLAKFYLNDGTTVIGRIIASQPNYKRIGIFLDINGDKKPNKFGKDIFEFSYNIEFTSTPVFEGKFVPSGYATDRDTLIETNCNKTQGGNLCTSVIVKDSWQIKDDYPW